MFNLLASKVKSEGRDTCMFFNCTVVQRVLVNKSNWSCSVRENNGTQAVGECVGNGLASFWRHLRSVIKKAHSNMESCLAWYKQSSGENSRKVCKSSVHNSLEFSQHHLVFISGYANKKNVFYCFIAPQVPVKHSIITGHWSFSQGTRIYEKISCDHGLRYANRGIFVYTFCALTYAYHYLMTLIK